MKNYPEWHSERWNHAERQLLHDVCRNVSAKNSNGRATAEHASAYGTDEVNEAKNVEQDNVFVPTRRSTQYRENHEWSIRTHDKIADPCGPRKCTR